MYQVYVGNRLIFENGLEDTPLAHASLELETGKSGSFEFTIYPGHPAYEAVERMAQVTVSREYSTLYAGRVLDIKYGFYGEKQVSCEGDLAFLFDVLVPPHSYKGSLTGYFEYILSWYNLRADNDHQITPGTVTVGEYAPFTVDETGDYKTVLDLMNAHLVANSGGYLRTRNEGGIRYLDLVSETADASNISGQSIELGVNMLDITKEQKGGGMFSAIIPLGAKLEGTEKRLDITSLNDGTPYLVNDAAVALCKGLIYRQVVFENITNVQTLLSAGNVYLDENYAGEYTIEVTAADLSGQDATIDFFRVGQWVRVYNEKHFGYSPQLFLIKKITINLLRPAENKITIGKVQKGFTDEVASIQSSVESISVPGAVQPYVMKSGTTGIWTWKVFSDNTCEFFGKIPVTSADVTSALGTWYKGVQLYDATAYEYPVQMSEAPAVNINFITRNGTGAFAWAYAQDAETARRYAPQCYLVRPTTATGIHGNINIIGKGKISL